jgi:hypothetical protein
MNIADIREFEETFVIHFGSDLQRINAYTLASTLVSLADAAKEANYFVNPGYEVEIVVEALGPGSFKAKIRTIYRGAKNLFSGQNLKTVVLAIIASYIYTHTLAPDIDINITVDDETVIIEQADKKIIIPKTVHEALKQVEKSDKFKRDVGRTFEAVEKDKNIKYIGFSEEFIDEAPQIKIDRDKFPIITSTGDDQSDTRQIIEHADLQILRAILERSRRRWEFVWRGVKISGPVLDSKFYNDFSAHKITIAPGDVLKVAMKIYQTRIPDVGIYTNDKYEIIEVLEHIPKLKQTAIDQSI